MLAVSQIMEDHQCDFSFMNIFTVVAFGFDELFAFKVEQIVLDLESDSHGFGEFGQNISCSFIEVKVGAD